MNSDDKQSTIIEKEFSESWDKIETFFTELSKKADQFKLLCKLIRELREKGYDKQLRAGQSLARFILSRSREWGLRREQPRVQIDARQDGHMILWFREGDYWTETEVEQIGWTVELQELLDKLLQYHID